MSYVFRGKKINSSYYRSRKSARRLAARTKRNFIVTLVMVGILIYSTFTWVLPFFINSIGVVKNTIQHPQKNAQPLFEEPILAPPVLSIPYEATNTAQINIAGFGTPNLKVKLYLDDSPIQTTDVSPEGSFSFENIDLSLGTNNIYAAALDDNNKESLPSKTIKLFYINEKPSLVITEPEDGKKIQGGDKKVKVSGKTDPGVKVFVNDSQVIVDGSGNFATDQPVNDGDNVISITAQDLALNTSEIQRTINYAN